MDAFWNEFSDAEQLVLVAFAVGVLIVLAGWALAQLVNPFDEDTLDDTYWSRKNAADSVESARRVQRAVASLKGDE